MVKDAHELSAHEYGAKQNESERYKAVKALARKTDHLLFLTYLRDLEPVGLVYLWPESRG